VGVEVEGGNRGVVDVDDESECCCKLEYSV
jgi:hypothetical protein